MRMTTRLGIVALLGVFLAGCASDFNSRLSGGTPPEVRGDELYYKRPGSNFPSDCELKYGKGSSQCKVPEPQE